MFQRLPADFQQQSLLRVHADGLAPRDRKKWRVEFIHVRQKTSAARSRAARRIHVGIEISRGIPAIRGNFRNRVGSIREQPPESVGTTVGSRDSATDSDDGDGRGAFFFDGVQARLQFQSEQGQPLRRKFLQALRKVAHCASSIFLASMRSTSSSESSSISPSVSCEPALGACVVSVSACANNNSAR